MYLLSHSHIITAHPRPYAQVSTAEHITKFKDHRCHVFEKERSTCIGRIHTLLTRS